MAAVAGYTSKPSWQLPPLRNRPALAVWASDDRLGTFIAGSPNAPPLAEDIYKLRLLDDEDEQSARDQPQSGPQVAPANISLRVVSHTSEFAHLGVCVRFMMCSGYSESRWHIDKLGCITTGHKSIGTIQPAHVSLAHVVACAELMSAVPGSSLSQARLADF